MDFCGADLRGYDFTGSDLRGCAKDDDTIIDETTDFSEAQIDWIEREALPIVIRMQEVQSLTDSTKRRRLLERLVSDYGITRHVIIYLISSACAEKSIEGYLDYIAFIPRNIERDQLIKLRHSGKKLLKKKFSSSRSRTRRSATAALSIDSIVAKLEKDQISVSSKIYGNLAEIVTSKEQIKSLNRMAFVLPEDLEAAFDKI